MSENHVKPLQRQMYSIFGMCLPTWPLIYLAVQCMPFTSTTVTPLSHATSENRENPNCAAICRSCAAEVASGRSEPLRATERCGPCGPDIRKSQKATLFCIMLRYGAHCIRIAPPRLQSRERKLNTFFSSSFSGAPRISRQSPGMSRQKCWFPGFRGTYRTFWPPPLHVEDLHPTGRCPDQKVWVLVPFSCLTESPSSASYFQRRLIETWSACYRGPKPQIAQSG